MALKGNLASEEEEEAPCSTTAPKTLLKVNNKNQIKESRIWVIATMRAKHGLSITRHLAGVGKLHICTSPS